MAKTLVVDTADGTRMPFLRGILTRSLHDAGVEFEDAYKLASSIRQDLAAEEEISLVDLRQRVVELLQKSFSEQVVDAYRSAARLPAPILVKDSEGQETPFSQAEHIRGLESCGLSAKQAKMITKKIHEHLLEHDISEIGQAELGRLCYDFLYKELGPDAARRYLVWTKYTQSGRPLILLIGGTTGCGKSTVATEVAHRLGVVRTQSTDMLREVMRMMIPRRLLPVLHSSAFDAWKFLPSKFSEHEDKEDMIADGYHNQMELLSVPCEAVIQRALRERVSLILEGVHVHPSLIDRIDDSEDAIIVPIMLAVLKQETLEKRLRGRGRRAPKRGSEHYLSNFDQIWSLQSYLLSEADRAGVPIIAENDKEKATIQIMRTIIDGMTSQCTATPDEVFAHD